MISSHSRHQYLQNEVCHVENKCLHGWSRAFASAQIRILASNNACVQETRHIDIQVPSPKSSNKLACYTSFNLNQKSKNSIEK